MEKENLEIAGAEKCESVAELDESSVIVGGERDASSEDKAVADAGGEEGGLENHVEARESELILEAAEEGGAGIAAQSEEPGLEMEAEEEAERIDDVKGEAAVTDTGDGLLLDESQASTKVDELLVETELEMETEEEFAPVVDIKMEMAATDSGVEVQGAPPLGTVTDASCGQPLSESQMDTRANEFQATMEGVEGHNYKSESDMGGGENVESVGGLDNESVDSQMVETNAETAVNGDEVHEEKVNDSEVGAAEKPAGIEEKKVDLITGEMPQTDIITEINACVVNDSAQEQVHASSGAKEYVSGNVLYEHAENKEVAVEENIMSRGFQLDEPVNVAEDEDIIVKEESPAGDSKAETEEAEEEEIQLADDSEVMANQTPDEDGKMDTEETASDVDEPGLDIYDSPAALQDEEDDAMVAEGEAGTQDTEMETETDIAESGKTSGGKRKRRKFTNSTSVSKATAKASSRKTVGEDVCFICFDGGELVLCDRRGCPKAYHPSCVNRDEAFFKSKGRWNCGWHLCSICEKNAHYMCYTCTFSLCKSCIKDAVILCIQANKGFCETCMRTVMLIEENEQGNKDIQIDFDDRSSWEFLFKDYYTELKAKLSLSPAEIAEAKNPWKGADNMSGPSKQESSEAQADANDGGSGSEDSIENVEIVRPKRRKIRKKTKSRSKEEESVSTGIAAGDKANSLNDNSEWASKELLEFVSHMKDGDTPMLSQFDVQALLLEYIKTNKLRDPRRKSQIICDARLENLFGKPRVGHFEMLKLLESHFLARDDRNDDFQGSVVDTDNNQLDTDGDLQNKSVKDKKRKSRKKGDNRGPQSNLDDYAAIDMHNIGLIYLRRKLMEDLLEDAEMFHDKVIGTFVRIRISGSTQKQDLYRIVQVAGTSKAAEPYKIGKKTTDTMVEILNLDKTEIISIDTISNQEFTEDECKRLRQSIKCGLISPLTVGEILDKTTEIQAARVNDWLESEILRLSHLRDRASDLGRRKELRECVEKLQLLKTPEERRRRLEEIPEIHADAKMDPSYESDGDSENEDTRRDAFMRSRGFSRRGRGPISPGSENSIKDSWSGAGKVKNWESNRTSSGNNFSTNASHIGEITNENSWNLEREKETQDSSNLEKLNSANNSESALRTVPRSESFSGATSVTPQASFSAGIVETAVKINESEKIWHYQDPSGKVQGPFSMVQLRKWNNTGYFPAGLKIWRNSEKQDNSVLLADALAGKFPKELPVVDNMFPASNTLHSSHNLGGHSGKTSGTSLNQDKERSIADQNSGPSLSKMSSEKWIGNDITNLPSPTPKQSNAGWSGGEGGLLTGAIQSPTVNGVVPSPAAVLPKIGTHSSASASALSSVVQPATFSPTPNSQQGIMLGSAVSLHNQSSTIGEPREAPMHVHQPASAAVQPAQTVVTQNLQADTQSWSSSAQSGQQPQGYGWGTPIVQNSSQTFPNLGSTTGPQHDVWRPTQGSLPNMHPPVTPNSSWVMGPLENNTPIGVRPENPNVGWGTMPANPNMGWGSSAPGNTNMNWAPAMQAPVPVPGPGSWVAPTGNTGANIPGMVPGNPNPGWTPAQTWAPPPVQGPVAGNGWVPPNGNAAPPPAAVQGPPPQGNTNQGWSAPPPPGNQGSWGGEQNHIGGQFPGPRGGGPQGRDPGFNGVRPWNRQSSYGGGGGSRFKREMLCPYNTNGRCRKGLRCDYRHT